MDFGLKTPFQGEVELSYTTAPSQESPQAKLARLCRGLADWQSRALSELFAEIELLLKGIALLSPGGRRAWMYSYLSQLEQTWHLLHGLTPYRADDIPVLLELYDELIL